jgi:anti-sigma regulatory factor (Ser/Thr protein kinase)
VVEHEMVIPPDPERLADVRHALGHSLAITQVDPDLAADMLVVVSEAVTNAIRHGDGDITTAWRIDDDQIELEVSDHGPGFTFSRPTWPGPDALAGRGLALIDRLTDWLEVSPLGSDGTTVRMRRSVVPFEADH